MQAEPKTYWQKMKAARLTVPGTAVAVFAFLWLLAPMGAEAGGFGNFIANYVFLLVAGWMGSLALTLIGILIDIAQYNDFITAPAVVRGWVIVRDVCNMFFIVVMLVIAFGTVFRMEEYQYKKLLSKLLIMAVLINFSKGITGFFIDFSQVIMLTFVNGFKEAAAGNFVNGFHLQDMFNFANKKRGGGELPEAGSDAYFDAALLALVTITITVVVVFVYLVVFLMRIVALWFLVIVSPLAYLMNAFPAGKKYHDMWWEYFGKYASTGPILAFFLWLSLSVMQLSNDAPLANFGEAYANQFGNNQGYVSASITGIGQSDVLLSFVTNIILLMGGLWMTQQLGVAGGKLAARASEGIHSAGKFAAASPFLGAKYAGKNWAERHYEKTGTDFNPVNYIKAWKENRERVSHERNVTGAQRGMDRAKEIAKGQPGDSDFKKRINKYRAVAKVAFGPKEDFLDTYGTLQGAKQLGKVLFGGKTDEEAREEAADHRFEIKKHEAYRKAKRDKGYIAGVGKQAATERLTNAAVDKLQGEAAGKRTDEQSVIDGFVTNARTQREAGSTDYNAWEEVKTNDKGKKETVAHLLEDEMALLGDWALKVDLKIPPATSQEAKEHQEVEKFLAGWDRSLAEVDWVKDRKATGKQNEPSYAYRHEEEVDEATGKSKQVTTFFSEAMEKAVGKESLPLVDDAANKLGLTPDALTAKTDTEIDAELAKLSLTPEELQKVRGAVTAKKKFLEGWDRSMAERDRSQDSLFDAKVQSEVEKISEADLVKEGRAHLTKKADEAEKKVRYLEDGGYSEEMAKSREQQIAYLLQQILATERQKADAEKLFASAKDPNEKLRLAEQIKGYDAGLGKLKKDYGKLNTRDSEGRLVATTAEEKETNFELNKKTISDLKLGASSMRGSADDDQTHEDTSNSYNAEDEEHHKQAKKYHMIPTGYYADREFRQLEHEEMSKLSQQPMEYEELNEMIDQADEQKDMLKYFTLSKKAANDYNDNEIWSAAGYDGGSEGIEKFRQEKLESWMGKQTSMRLINEINYINEDKGHNNASRMYGVKGGTFYKRSAYEQAAIVTTEAMKKNMRNFFQSSNRLAYGYEEPSGRYHIDLAGQLMITAGQDDLAYRIGRSEMNQSALMKWTEDLGTIRKLKNMGMLTAKVSGGRYNGLNVADAIERLARDVEARGGASNVQGFMQNAMRINQYQ